MNDINTTTFRIVVTTVLFTFEVISVMFLMYYEKAINEIVLGMVFGATLGMAGVDYKQFAKKRETYKPPVTVVLNDEEHTVEPEKPMEQLIQEKTSFIKER